MTRGAGRISARATFYLRIARLHKFADSVKEEARLSSLEVLKEEKHVSEFVPRILAVVQTRTAARVSTPTDTNTQNPTANSDGHRCRKIVKIPILKAKKQ